MSADPTTNLTTNITVFKFVAAPDTIGLLHPDRYQTNQDTAVSQITQHNSLINSYIPGLTAGENRELKENGTFQVAGLKAYYYKQLYVNVPNPILAVVSSVNAS